MAFPFEELQVYQKALEFSVSVIDGIDSFDTPRNHYRLIEQLEASCTSVPMNIAEGRGRYSKKEYARFLYIARGSLFETITMLQIFKKKEWIKSDDFKELYGFAEEISKMLSGLIKSIQQ
jgi:four helix bundle protein